VRHNCVEGAMNIWNYEVSLAEALWGLVAQRVGVWQGRPWGAESSGGVLVDLVPRTIVFGTHRRL